MTYELGQLVLTEWGIGYVFNIFDYKKTLGLLFYNGHDSYKHVLYEDVLDIIDIY
jgi:hypothetical protein